MFSTSLRGSSSADLKVASPVHRTRLSIPPLRNLIDDSVQEENTSAAAATLAFPHHNDANPGLDASSVGKGCVQSFENANLFFHNAILPDRSTHSLSGLDSPMPPPPVTHCCIQGCVRKKTILRDGRRPAVSSWQRFWIQVSGPHLVFYSPKSLRG